MVHGDDIEPGELSEGYLSDHSIVFHTSACVAVNNVVRYFVRQRRPAYSSFHQVRYNVHRKQSRMRYAIDTCNEQQAHGSLSRASKCSFLSTVELFISNPKL